MNLQRLCPVYKKWLQLNPSHAREHRTAMQVQTQQAHQAGKLNEARTLGYQTFEAAKVVLTALQPVNDIVEKSIHEDILAFGTMAMYLASLLHKEEKKHEAHQILQECHQQLIAILPLHASKPSVCKLICAIQLALEKGSGAMPHEHQQALTLH
ncbi:hypothetical protein Q4561_06975 [Alteromonas sp. 1_MG-2023]|uniref:hypothetical protein n=1 Tax=Alteromonas sp. 1_MG-2023 TaxID=3062669 RepID=UPI0026E3262F|nr:hypothetical protein [Alteromonas sp. 1_MG-2023]MDO6566795.1 hypothetical protein [Alteromonas sp. 1_MG-2023]